MLRERGGGGGREGEKLCSGSSQVSLGQKLDEAGKPWDKTQVWNSTGAAQDLEKVLPVPWLTQTAQDLN